MSNSAERNKGNISQEFKPINKIVFWDIKYITEYSKATRGWYRLFSTSLLLFWAQKFKVFQNFLELCFLTVTLKAILTQFYHKNTSCFQAWILKHNSIHVPTLNLTCKLFFEPSFHMVIIDSYYRKKASTFTYFFIRKFFIRK